MVALCMGGTLAAAPLEYRGIEIDKDNQTVSFPAEINMHEGMLEYLLVASTGKTHESLLSTKVEPYDIQVAMLLLGIKPAANADTQPPAQITNGYLKNAPELTGERIALSLSWTDSGGPHRAAPESMIWNLASNAVMTNGPWVYNSSELYGGRFLAQIDGSITALVRDPAALINNPRPGNDNDQIWEVYSSVTPPAGTGVDVTIELEEVPTK